MTQTQKIQLRQSEVRQKLNAILGVDDRTADQTAELETLTAEAQGLEVEYRAAVVAEPPADDDGTRTPTGDPEERERMEIRDRARLARFVDAAISGRAVDGAEAEVAAAFGCPGAVPLAMFETRERQPEERAVTPSPATAATSLGAIVPAMFQRSAAAWLGVDMPSVAAGDAGFAVVGTSVTGGVKAKSAESAETEGAITVTTAQPRRITGAFRFTREDAARLSGMEGALRENLSSVLSDAADGQAVNGSGAGDGTINGLIAILTAAAAPAAGVEDFARYNAAMLSHVDGVFATDRTGVRGLLGAATYRHAAGVFTGATSEVSALDYLTGEVRRRPSVEPHPGRVVEYPEGDHQAQQPGWGSRGGHAGLGRSHPDPRRHHRGEKGRDRRHRPDAGRRRESCCDPARSCRTRSGWRRCRTCGPARGAARRW